MFELIPYSTRRLLNHPFADFDDDFWSDTVRGIRADVTDNGDSYTLESDLPGFKKEDIKIDLEDDMMTISAERKLSDEQKDKNGYVRRERSYGSFSRSFNVTGIDAANISAAYNDGVLTLTLPKLAEVKPGAKQIAIQ